MGFKEKAHVEGELEAFEVPTYLGGDGKRPCTCGAAMLGHPWMP